MRRWPILALLSTRPAPQARPRRRFLRLRAPPTRRPRRGQRQRPPRKQERLPSRRRRPVRWLVRGPSRLRPKIRRTAHPSSALPEKKLRLAATARSPSRSCWLPASRLGRRSTHRLARRPQPALRLMLGPPVTLLLALQSPRGRHSSLGSLLNPRRRRGSRLPLFRMPRCRATARRGWRRSLGPGLRPAQPWTSLRAWLRWAGRCRMSPRLQMLRRPSPSPWLQRLSPLLQSMPPPARTRQRPLWSTLALLPTSPAVLGRFWRRGLRLVAQRI